uniref:Plasmid stability protein n=1 Tax=Candidatus Kentrum sp. TUN TaxID=2126343 RepID=A0A450ZMJ3_9GAMM|nr:MAG: Plasmid stability protein [Candidatus Kentron sp. TUN]VFK58583.1 MAG: Plasmid stability protein [Candidatus Kentron sp. TUN]VFK61154.1 MAG: Plasmid stability protein [Candidatus Kentron sp. TUN]
MPAVTIRNLSGETHRALKVRATQHRHSMEAEIRSILEETVRPDKRVKIGSALAAFGQRHGGLDLDTTRNPGSPEPVVFE